MDPVNFAIFAFDLMAIMNGTYKIGEVSSFHGLPHIVDTKIARNK